MAQTFFRYFILISLLSLVMGCQTSRENKLAAQSHYQLGTSNLQQKNYPQGLKHLLTARKLDSKNELVHNQLGVAYFLMKEMELSVLSFKKALSVNSEFSEAHNNLGRVYAELKDFTSARKHLNIAAKDLTYSKKDKVLFNLGLSYFYEKKYKEARQYFLQTIAANRGNCMAYNYNGRSHIELEKFEEAQKSLDQAIYKCRGKNYDEPHYYSAIAFFRIGQKNRALARLQEAKKMYPKGPYRKKINDLLGLLNITESRQ